MFACKQDLELQDVKGFWLESGFSRKDEGPGSWVLRSLVILYHAVKFLDAPLQYIYIYLRWCKASLRQRRPRRLVARWSAEN